MHKWILDNLFFLLFLNNWIKLFVYIFKITGRVREEVDFSFKDFQYKTTSIVLSNKILVPKTMDFYLLQTNYNNF